MTEDVTEYDGENTFVDNHFWSSRDLRDDIITGENFPGGGAPELLAWIAGLGLNPSDIPRDALVIDPNEMRLYWREFLRDEVGARQTSSGDRSRRTRTKSMPLAELPSFLI